MLRLCFTFLLVVSAVLLGIASLAAESPFTAIGTAFSGLPAASWTWLFIGGSVAAGLWLWMALVPQDS